MTRSIRILLVLLLAAFTVPMSAPAFAASSAKEINRDADEALQKLYKTNDVAEKVGKQAEAILIFPNIVKAGLILGRCDSRQGCAGSASVVDVVDALTVSGDL